MPCFLALVGTKILAQDKHLSFLISDLQHPVWDTLSEHNDVCWFLWCSTYLGWVSQLDLCLLKRERVLPLGLHVPCISSIFLNTLQDGHDLQPHCASVGAESREVEPFMEAAQLGKVWPSWVGLGLTSPCCPLLPLPAITSRPLSWRTFGIPGPLPSWLQILCLIKTLRIQISNPCIYILSSLTLTLSIITASIPHNNRLLGSRKNLNVPLVNSIPAQWAQFILWLYIGISWEFFKIQMHGSHLSPHKSEICWGQAQTSLFTNPINSSVVSWLRLYTSTAGNMGSIPGQETRLLLATWYSKKRKKGKRKKILLMLLKALYSKEQGWVFGIIHPCSQCCSSGPSPVTLKETCNLSEWPFPNL